MFTFKIKNLIPFGIYGDYTVYWIFCWCKKGPAMTFQQFKARYRR